MSIGPSDTTEAAGRIAGLMIAGLPLPEGLRAIGEESGNRRLRAALSKAADDLEAGDSVGEALDRLTGSLPPYLAARLRAGVRGGRLAEVAGDSTLQESPAMLIRRRVRIGLIYPSLLTSIGLASIAVFSTIIGGIADVFGDFGIALPAVSDVVIRIGLGVGSAGPWVLVGPVCLLAIAWLSFRLFYTTAQRSRVIQRIPGLGPIWRLTAWAEFCRILAALLELDLPMPEALPIAAESCGLADLELSRSEAAARIAAGEPIGRVIGSSGRDGRGLGRFLDWAEAQGSLAESLPVAASILEARARAGADRLVALAAFFAISFVVWWVVVFVAAILWPMLKLLQAFT